MEFQYSRELESSSLSVDGRAELACELAKELEYKGEYEQAQRVLDVYWPQIGEQPDVEGLESRVAAEVFLRAGVLTGIIGSKKQIADAQETAKNLISESLTVFESRNDPQKVAEAQTELALCYWRTGENSEARDLLYAALSRLTVESEPKAKAVVRLAIVENEAGAHDRALNVLTDYAPLFQRISNQTLKGSYHATLGNVLRRFWELKRGLDFLDRALVEYAAASYHFEQAEHRSYLAVVENNLGLLYFKIDALEEAHEHLRRARHIQVSLRDISAMAEVDETRACVFLKQGRINEAERASRSAVSNQEKSGRLVPLTEALITHGRALARLDRFASSLATFRRAIELSEQIGNTNRASQAALAAFQELGDRMTVTPGPQQASGSSGRGLIEEIRTFEHDVIKRALENSRGSVTNAARSLGMSYQALSYMLKTRHKDLLRQRTPVRPRPRAKGN
jgi:tetratricopeptide (TPR) repeat protein